MVSCVSRGMMTAILADMTAEGAATVLWLAMLNYSRSCEEDTLLLQLSRG